MPRAPEAEAGRLAALRAAWQDPDKRRRMVEPRDEARKLPEFTRQCRAGQIGVYLTDEEALIYNRLRRKGCSREEALVEAQRENQ